jgi:hypothetical protein
MLNVFDWLVIFFAVSLLGGCLGAADLMKALAKDEASNCVRVTSIYGTVLMSRTKLASGTLTCNGDGLTVRPTP